MNENTPMRFTVVTILAFVCLLPLILSGCGQYREELEQAKRQVERLSSANKQLTDAVGRLESEKSGLVQEVKELRERNGSLDKDLETLKKTHAQLAREKTRAEDGSKELQQEVLSLKKANDDLQKQVARLKDESTSSVTTGPMKDRAPVPEDSGLKSDIEQPEKRADQDPCDALVDYMRKVGTMLRMATKEQRPQKLEQIKQEYRVRMQGAPEKAKAAAESWVTELVQGWDKPGDDLVFNLIRKRDAALKGCNEDPGREGF
jgi:chromosome segregation ATPase